MLFKELKTASRTRLVEGRTSMPSGVLNRRPRASPAMIRSTIAQSSGGRGSRDIGVMSTPSPK